MKLKLRFSLIGIGILIFTIATPLIVLYARGFKYDFVTHKLVKTGTLVIKTDPTGATIYLDNQTQSAKTAAVIRFLSPKDYEVRLEKDGYQPWTKRLGINAQYVTWAAINRDYITLFSQTPKLGPSWPVIAAALSEDRQEFFLIDAARQAESINVNTGHVSVLGPFDNADLPNLTNPLLHWTDAGKNFEIIISKTRQLLPASLLNQITTAQSDGNHIIFIANGDLYEYEIDKVKLIEHKVRAATLGPDGIWYLAMNQLKYLKYNSEQPEITLDQVPIYAHATMLWAENRLFITLDQTLYIFNEKLEPISSPVTFTQWDSTSDQLLYGNDNELKLYNPNTQTSQLILRSLDRISNPVLNTATGYLFYQQNQSIKAVELDNRNGQNSYTIMDLTNPGAIFAISADGRQLYLFDKDQVKEFTIR